VTSCCLVDRCHVLETPANSIFTSLALKTDTPFL
jgi:hypothetical protein